MTRIAPASSLARRRDAARSPAPPPRLRHGTRRRAPTGLAAFETVRAVLQHPRCQNCHPAGDAPLQGDDGPRARAERAARARRARHGRRASARRATARRTRPSSYGAHIPPGVATGWHMPPPEEKMVFVGVRAARAVRADQGPGAQRRQGHGRAAHAPRRSARDLGLEPGLRPRAGVHAVAQTFLAAWETWAAAGAPCPD